MKKNRKPLLISLFILIGACIIGVVWSIIDFKVINKEKSYVYETIQFDFDGASDGLDPNGNRFNPISFLTDEVITNALNEVNMHYDVDVVRQNIAMENDVPKGIIEEIDSYTSIMERDDDSNNFTSNDYHPVRYKFALYSGLDRKLSKKDLSKLLKAIVDSYYNSFYKIYQKDFDSTGFDEIYSMDSYDYIYQVQVLTNKLSVLSSSASTIYNEHDDFNIDGKTFNDIALKCNQLSSSDASRIRSIIILNALSIDIERLKDYYNYKIEILGYDKVKYQSDLDNITLQVNAYAKDSTVYVSSGENIVKVESNSASTYNSLLSSQISLANRIASINTEISDYQSILDDINNAAVGTEEDYTLVKNYIIKLSSDYDALEEEFNGLVDKYNDKYVLNGVISETKIRYHSNSIFSSAFIARCVKVCAPIGLITLLGISISLLIFECRKKKETRE